MKFVWLVPAALLTSSCSATQANNGNPYGVLGCVLLGAALVSAFWQWRKDRLRLPVKVDDSSRPRSSEPATIPVWEVKDAVPQQKPGPSRKTQVAVGRIVGVSGPYKDKAFPVLTATTTIGALGTHVVLNEDPSVSSHHANIVVTDEGRIFFEDRSQSGSRVGGEYLRNSREEIKGPCDLVLGASCFRIELNLFSTIVPEILPDPILPEVEPEPVEEDPFLYCPGTGPSGTSRTTISSEFFEEEEDEWTTPESPRAELIEKSEDGGERRLPITRPITNFGKGKENTIVLDHATISQKHAVLEERDGRFYLRDEGSRYGTRVNRNRADPDAELRHGDEISFARAPLIYIFQTNRD